jgi:NAD(P)-dependent dehydrogenase (short-subunit alcohol dehydrogenase family)
METLSGQTALITGSSRGIGRAIARKLHGMGASVIVHYRENEEQAKTLAQELGGRCQLVKADLAQPDSIEAMFRELGGTRLDMLINNAGVWKPTPLGAAKRAVVEEVLAVNLMGVYWTTHCALPLLKDGARIVNISSVAGRTGVAGGRSLYGATKAAVDSLTRNWALELAPRKILVNAVAPGYVATDMTAEHFADPATYERALARHPLGRMGTAEDVAETVAYLCSPGAAFITGQSLNASGGFII